MDYQPVVIKSHPRPSSSKHGAESRYWRQFKHPVFVKEHAPVTAVHFSPSKPHRYSVTAGTRVQLYAPRTQKVIKIISRFRDVARSGNIREDGKLVVAGDDSGLVQVFDISSRAILRTLDVHKQPVHVAKFSPLTATQVLSCSDDTTVRLWDVPSQSTISTFVAHTDYVRAGQLSPVNPHIILTASYDSTIRLFDARSGDCEMVMGVDTSFVGGTPVEQVLMFPSGSAVLSSAGPIIRIWDIVAGGRCIRALSNHQKTVTSLALGANASRLLTGGLDQMVKVYDISSYKVVHTMRYPAPILCLALSPDESHIVAGMSDGTLSIRRRQGKACDIVDESPQMHSFLGTTLPAIGKGTIRSNDRALVLGDVEELRVENLRKKRLRDYDRLLKNFRYSAALDAVLCKHVTPTTAFALVQELVHRDGLETALSGRDDVLLEPVLRLLIKFVADPRFGDLVCDVAGIVIDMYAQILGQSPLIDTLFLRLKKKVAMEMRFQKELTKFRGILDMIINSVTLESKP